MQVECGHCKKRYSIGDENAGKQFVCRACGQKSLVTPIGAAAPVAAASKTAAAKTAQAKAGPATLAAPATLSVTCPKCGKQYQNVPATAVGKQFKCKVCQEISPIRAASAPAAKQARPAGASPATVRKDAAALAGKASPLRPAAKPAAAKVAAVASAPAPRAADRLASDPLVSDPLGQDLFGGSANLLDLMGEAPLPGASATPLASPLLAKPVAAAPAKKAKAKKKKKKGGGVSGDNATVLLRMMGGGVVALCGLGLIIWAIVVIANPDDSGLHVARAIRRFIGGASLIGAGFKTIIG